MKFALLGNPNSGKTTLFNLLTGSTAHVGNWPGVTVEKKSGVYKKLPEKSEIVDLPGIYSLSPYTPEEIVSRNFVLDESPDCVINVVDATNLERNLYLSTQALELDVPVVVALNMMDAVERQGDKIDTEKLSEKLGVPVVEISALKNKGVQELMSRAYAAAKSGVRVGNSPAATSTALKPTFERVKAAYVEHGVTSPTFHAVKAIEGDAAEQEQYAELVALAADCKQTVDTGEFEGDFEGVVADARYKYITDRLNVLTRAPRSEKMTCSDKADKVLTHKWWGIPLFLLIMLAIFHLTFSENLLFIGYAIPEGSFDIPIIGTDAINSPGVMLQSAMTWLTDLIAGGLSSVMPPDTWYTGLIVDGLWGGLSSVLSFIPQIMLLFLFLSVLEDSGYMARVAFIMDRAFRKFGLSGKAFLPLLMCFGCAVPGIMATRTLENEGERRRTILLSPFFSCGAKLPIWAAFAGVFAHNFAGLNAELIVFAMYFIGIAVAIIAAFILNITAKKSEVPPFIMELPAYHSPQAKSLGVHLWDKLKHYLVRAGTVIAGAIVVIWFLSSFNFEWQYVTDSGESILGSLGKLFNFLFIPLGFGMGENGWKFVVAAFTGLIAKEMVVATMGTFAGMDGDAALDADPSDLSGTSVGAMMLTIGGTLGALDVSIPAMFSFMVFNLLSVPCMAAVAAASGELNSRKKTWQAIGFWMLTAYVTSLFVFWFGVLCTLAWWAGLLVGLAIVGILVVLFILGAKGKLRRREKAGKEAGRKMLAPTVATSSAFVKHDAVAKPHVSKFACGGGSCGSCPYGESCGHVQETLAVDDGLPDNVPFSVATSENATVFQKNDTEAIEPNGEECGASPLSADPSEKKRARGKRKNGSGN